MSKSLIRSYVADKYFVSTIYRQSSACMESPPWFYETIAWEWQLETGRGEVLRGPVDSGNWVESALESHFNVCRDLAVETQGGDG